VNTNDGAEQSNQNDDAPRDVDVIGGGVAGLSAALTLGRACRRVLVLDDGSPRNRFASHVHGTLGHEGIDPTELLRRGREELGTYDVTVRNGTVERVSAAGPGTWLTVALADGAVVTCRAVVVASGTTDELPDLPGLAELWGTDVLHCPYCHGWEVRGQRLGILGTSPMSLHQAEMIPQWSDQVVFFSAGCEPVDDSVRTRLRARGTRVVERPVAEVLRENGHLTGVRLDDGTTVGIDALFVAPTPRPHDSFLDGLDLDRTEYPAASTLTIDPHGRTGHPRIWAVGNVVDPPANVPISVGAGSRAGASVNMALIEEDVDRAVTREYWESQYAQSPHRWSGRVNPTLAEVVESLPRSPGAQALDLGCGEGGDAVWLAGQGYRVTAVDVSRTAIARGRAGAREQGVDDRITWVVQDLAAWDSEDAFDLVTASFFHSTVDLPRTEILRRAAGRVHPGGHLLIVSHVFEDAADIPPWSLRHHGTEDPEDPELRRRLRVLLTPEQEIAALALDPATWEVVHSEVRGRETIGPDGTERHTVKDGVVLFRRRRAPRSSETHRQPLG
jgi:thioredoxin reductase/SAM-dependent methyltransferase